MNIKSIQFVAPRSVTAGELVMDPNTGSWGFARSHYSGGDIGTYSAGSGYVVTVEGAPTLGSEVWCLNGVLSARQPAVDATPCAEVVSVIQREEGSSTVLIALR